MISSICGKLRDPVGEIAALCVLTPGHEGEHDYREPEEVDSPPDSDDLEITALTECVRVLNPLTPVQLRRVFHYLGIRYLDNLEQQRTLLNKEIARLEKERSPAKSTL